MKFKWNLVYNEISFSEIIFLFAYEVFLAYQILMSSAYARYIYKFSSKANLCIIFLLFCSEILNSKISRKDFTILFLISAFVVEHRLITGEVRWSMLLTILFVFCSRRYSFEKITKLTVLVSSISVLFVIFSAYQNWIPNYYSAMRQRHFLGFRYPLYGSAYFFNIAAVLIYIRKAFITWKELIFIFLVNLWFFQQTDSKLSCYMLTMLLAITTIIKVFPFLFEKFDNIKKLMIGSYWMCAACSLIITIYYRANIPVLQKINIVLSGRLALGQQSLQNYGIKLWGQSITWLGWGLNYFGRSDATVETYSFVDCAYIQILQRYGLIAFLFFLLLLTLSMYRAYMKHDYFALMILTLSAIHGLIDDLIIYLHYNTFLFVVCVRLITNSHSVEIQKRRFFKKIIIRNFSDSAR